MNVKFDIRAHRLTIDIPRWGNDEALHNDICLALGITLRRFDPSVTFHPLGYFGLLYAGYKVPYRGEAVAIPTPAVTADQLEDALTDFLMKKHRLFPCLSQQVGTRIGPDD